MLFSFTNFYLSHLKCVPIRTDLQFTFELLVRGKLNFWPRWCGICHLFLHSTTIITIHTGITQNMQLRGLGEHN